MVGDKKSRYCPRGVPPFPPCLSATMLQPPMLPESFDSRVGCVSSRGSDTTVMLRVSSCQPVPISRSIIQSSAIARLLSEMDDDPVVFGEFGTDTAFDRRGAFRSLGVELDGGVRRVISGTPPVPQVANFFLVLLLVIIGFFKVAFHHRV